MALDDFLSVLLGGVEGGANQVLKNQEAEKKKAYDTDVSKQNVLGKIIEAIIAQNAKRNQLDLSNLGSSLSGLDLRNPQSVDTFTNRIFTSPSTTISPQRNRPSLFIQPQPTNRPKLSF